MPSENLYLAHYGIKGMRWGVRKAKNSGGSRIGEKRALRKLAKATNAVNKADAKRRSKTKVHRLSDAPDARAIVTQNINAERKYNKAASRYNKTMMKVMKKYGDISIENVDKQQIKDGKYFVDTLKFDRSGNSYDVLTKGYRY